MPAVGPNSHFGSQSSSALVGEEVSDKDDSNAANTTTTQPRTWKLCPSYGSSLFGDLSRGDQGCCIEVDDRVWCSSTTFGNPINELSSDLYRRRRGKRSVTATNVENGK